MNTACTPGTARAADVSMLDDPGAGEGTAHEARMEHSRPHDVIDIRAVTGQQTGVLHSWHADAGVARCAGA